MGVRAWSSWARSKRSVSSTNAPSKKADRPKCFTCGQNGHLQRECPHTTWKVLPYPSSTAIGAYHKVCEGTSNVDKGSLVWFSPQLVYRVAKERAGLQVCLGNCSVRGWWFKSAGILSCKAGLVVSGRFGSGRTSEFFTLPNTPLAEAPCSPFIAWYPFGRLPRKRENSSKNVTTILLARSSCSGATSLSGLPLIQINTIKLSKGLVEAPFHLLPLASNLFGRIGIL